VVQLGAEHFQTATVVLGSQTTAATKDLQELHYSPRTIQNLHQLCKEVSTKKASKYEATKMYMTVHYIL